MGAQASSKNKNGAHISFGKAKKGKVIGHVFVLILFLRLPNWYFQGYDGHTGNISKNSYAKILEKLLVKHTSTAYHIFC